MPLSVRLDKKIEELLDETAEVLKTTKTEVIKRSLSEYCPRVLVRKRKRPYELIEDLLGKEGSGKGDLSLKAEEILRKRLRRGL